MGAVTEEHIGLNSLVLLSLRFNISDLLGKLLECVLVGGVLGLKLWWTLTSDRKIKDTLTAYLAASLD